MAASVGVIFYWLRSGDHPEVARQTRDKLSIDSNEGITVARAIEIICKQHIISLSRYTVQVFEEKSNRQLTNMSELLTNYSRIYLKIDSKKLDGATAASSSAAVGGGHSSSILPSLSAVGDEALSGHATADGGEGGSLSGGDEWGSFLKTSAPSSSWRPLTASSVQKSGKDDVEEPSMERILNLSSHTAFPLGLARRTHTPAPNTECPLCSHELPNSAEQRNTAIYLDCCGYTCCRACLHYLRSSELFSEASRCAVCGCIDDALVAEEARRNGVASSSTTKPQSEVGKSEIGVKREREEAEGEADARKADDAEEADEEMMDLDDDDFGSSEPLKL